MIVCNQVRVVKKQQKETGVLENKGLSSPLLTKGPATLQRVNSLQRGTSTGSVNSENFLRATSNGSAGSRSSNSLSFPSSLGSGPSPSARSNDAGSDRGLSPQRQIFDPHNKLPLMGRTRVDSFERIDVNNPGLWWVLGVWCWCHGVE